MDAGPNTRTTLRTWAVLCALGVLLGCDDESTRVAPIGDDLVSTAVADDAPPVADEAPSPDHTLNGSQPDIAAATTAERACPPDMERVSGNFCPQLSQRCVQPGNVAKGDPSDHCKRYAKARCLSKVRQPMRFCMDRYEWPNVAGEKPQTLVSWTDAQAHCEARGKRLCSADEFTFACEGEQMNAHVYGNERDNRICHFDQRYIERTYNYASWQACRDNPACLREYQRIDQRLPAGAMSGCVSPNGIYDLNGNVNEWVARPQQSPPHRSGLKGGWWGPVRNRCRPMTTFHPEHDYGYEAGFRCCADAG